MKLTSLSSSVQIFAKFRNETHRKSLGEMCIHSFCPGLANMEFEMSRRTLSCKYSFFEIERCYPVTIRSWLLLHPTRRYSTSP